MVNPKPISRGRVRVDFTRRPTLACSGQPDQRSPVLLAPRRRAADAGRWADTCCHTAPKRLRTSPTPRVSPLSNRSMSVEQHALATPPLSR
jgi:hypothetical protein